MAEIRLNISNERLDLLTVDELIVIEDVSRGIVNVKVLTEIMARFVVDESGAYLEEDAANKVVSGLLRQDFVRVAKEFLKGIMGLLMR